ncbi:MAG: dihydrofolate reductase family protein [Acidimicrobiales bacterium]
MVSDRHRSRRSRPPPAIMITMFPRPSDDPVAVVEAVGAERRTPPANRCWVMTNMVASADGATAIDGLSGPLGGAADREMFAALRSVADAIVVGAATVRQERYRVPGAGSEEAQRARAGRGQEPRPLVVVVTTSLGLDAGLPLFDDPSYRPLIATVATAPAEARDRLSTVADIVELGEERVDVGLLASELRRRGVAVALAEGGPTLNGQLIAADLVDEWNLTLSPILAGGASHRPAIGAPIPHPTAQMRLDRVWQDDDLLFCRWTRPGAS